MAESERKPVGMYAEEVVDVLKTGGLAVVPTDTIYGIVCSALSKEAVEKIYAIKKRDTSKPFIVLIGDMGELDKFGISLSDSQNKILRELWPGPVSVILPARGEGHEYLHRGTGNIAFRLPDDKDLREFLVKTGPLVAPSANPEGLKPAETTEEAIEYFGDEVDIYSDGGTLRGKPSRLIRLLESGEHEVLR